MTGPLLLVRLLVPVVFVAIGATGCYDFCPAGVSSATSCSVGTYVQCALGACSLIGAGTLMHCANCPIGQAGGGGTSPVRQNVHFWCRYSG